MSVTPEVDKLVFEYEGSLGFTVLQNIFIEQFMPAANGSYVKVYLAGLKRCFGYKDSQWATHRTIAEESGKGVSISTVKRAWKYWESVGLVHVFPRFLRDINNPNDYSTQRTRVYRIPTSSIIRFTNLQQLAQDIAVRQAIVKAQAEAVASIGTGVGSPVNLGSGHQWTEGRVMGELQINTREEIQKEEIQDKTTISQKEETDVVSSPNESPQKAISEADLKSSTDLYLNLTHKTKIGKSDINHLSRLLITYGLEDVTDALQEAAKSDKPKGNFLRYTEGILTNWIKEGKRLSISSDSSIPNPPKKARDTKESSAKRNPEEARYYANYAKLEQELLDSKPIEEPKDLIDSDIDKDVYVGWEEEHKANMIEFKKALRLA